MIAIKKLGTQGAGAGGQSKLYSYWLSNNYISKLLFFGTVGTPEFLLP